jgi:predicted amidophosphoribosyltransferase
MRRVCRGCGAVQHRRLMLCERCNKPLVFDESFVCPRCKSESFNFHDIVEGYCGRCHLFAELAAGEVRNA